MSRPVRLEIPGASYYVSNHGIENHPVFVDEEDYLVFLQILSTVVGRFEWVVHAYALLDDHYHLVMDTPKANLSRGMRQLNGVYTQHYNRKHKTEGPLFHGRFKSVVFEREEFLCELCRHVVLNPIRSSLAITPEKYRWTSFRATGGLIKGPAFLCHEDVLGCFGKRTRDNQRKYRRYIREGLGMSSPLANRMNQVLLGGDDFLEEMQGFLTGRRKGPKQATRRRGLNSLFGRIANKSRKERNELIQKAHIEHGYTLMEIGEHLDLHYTTISKVINA